MQFKPAFIAHTDLVCGHAIDVITAAEQSGFEPLGQEETGYLYNILGIFACNNHYVQEEKRYQILEWAIGRLLQELASCPSDNVEKMSRIVLTIKTTTKGFKQALTGKFVSIFKGTIEQLVPLLGRHMNHQMLVKQVVFFVQSNITTLGLEILPIMQQLTQVCIESFPFDKMEDILILVNFSAA